MVPRALSSSYYSHHCPMWMINREKHRQIQADQHCITLFVFLITFLKQILHSIPEIFDNFCSDTFQKIATQLQDSEAEWNEIIFQTPWSVGWKKKTKKTPQNQKKKKNQQLGRAKGRLNHMQHQAACNRPSEMRDVVYHLPSSRESAKMTGMIQSPFQSPHMPHHVQFCRE